MTAHAEVARNNVWREHPTFAQLLGLCPLLAVTTSVTRAVALAVATSVVLIATGVLVSLLRRMLARELRLLSYLLVIGALVSAVDFTLRAYYSALHAQLGIFVPLIASNCVILSRAERCATGSGPLAALRDALGYAAAVTLAFALFGAARELIAHGTLLAGANALAGGDGSSPGLRIFDGGFLLVALTPGAFLALAFLSALHRRFIVRVAQPARLAAAATG